MAPMSVGRRGGNTLPSRIAIAVTHPNSSLLFRADGANRCRTAADDHRYDDDERSSDCIWSSIHLPLGMCTADCVHGANSIKSYWPAPQFRDKKTVT